MEWLWFILAGALGGILGGMGMGGGTVLIPLLSIGLNVPQHLAQAINLISFVPMAIIAIIIHAKNGLIKTDGLLKMILCGLVFCVLGSFIAKNIEADHLRRIFGGFLTVLSIFQVYGIMHKKRTKK